MKNAVFLSLALFLALSSSGQDFSGKYVYNGASGRIVLDLAKNTQGMYSGSLSGNNNVFRLSGRVENGFLKGIIGETGSGLVFIAVFQGSNLSFTMADTDYAGNLNTATAQVLAFVRTSEDPVLNADLSQESVIINNTALSKEQIRDIVSRYGVAPKPGNYWYDPVSGLYGVTGYPSYGFMYPDHQFGTLARNASAGNTGVLVNGRELPQLEWIVWSYIIGTYIQSGSYWFDSTGNVGYQGNPVPVLNLFAMARQNGYTGKGSGGDNFWSTRFSAGNSNSDNSQGYVSVPGYGPVGYGF